MTPFTPLCDLPQKKLFQSGDLLILFGELFGRGYANGVVEMAKKNGMTIVGITVGRRDGHSILRPLNAEEHAESEERLGGKIINIPLEAGFDLDAPDGSQSPAEMLHGLTKDNWKEFQPDPEYIDLCRQIGRERFQNGLRQVIAKIFPLIKPGKNVYFLHTMAGGVPRSKITMVVANRVFKGKGTRYISSEEFWKSSLGQLAAKNFEDVTANTFHYLLEATAEIRDFVQKNGGETRYSAYGYHGTEVLINDEYRWQTYTPYQQGHAKKKLEAYSREAWEKGINACVFNCPEIKTNSSDIFLGVELSLFPLLLAFKKECSPQWTHKQWAICQEKLSENVLLDDILQELNNYFESEIIKKFLDFESWPMENTLELAELMVGSSEKITNLHKNRKDLITNFLSSFVLDATGPIIFNEMAQPRQPVFWLGHEIIAKQLNVLYP